MGFLTWMAQKLLRLPFLNHFYGELIKRYLPAFAEFECGPECRVVLLERFENRRGLVLQKRFDFFVGKVALEECLGNAVIAGGVHANVGGERLGGFAIGALRGDAASKAELVAAARAGKVAVYEFKACATVSA